MLGLLGLLKVARKEEKVSGSPESMQKFMHIVLHLPLGIARSVTARHLKALLLQAAALFFQSLDL